MNTQTTTTTQTTRKPNLVTQLQHAAQKHAALSDLCHWFAARERARNQVTIANIRYVMTREGFKHTEDEYREALKLLGSLGIGTVKYDKHRRVMALTGITLTLQSIGKAALGGAETLRKFRPANKYKPLVPGRIPPLPAIVEKSNPLQEKPIMQPTIVLKESAREPVYAPSPKHPGIATVIIASPDGSITTVQMNNELVLTIAKLAQKPS